MEFVLYELIFGGYTVLLHIILFESKSIEPCGFSIPTPLV